MWQAELSGRCGAIRVGCSWLTRGTYRSHRHFTRFGGITRTPLGLNISYGAFMHPSDAPHSGACPTWPARGQLLAFASKRAAEGGDTKKMGEMIVGLVAQPNKRRKRYRRPRQSSEELKAKREAAEEEVNMLSAYKAPQRLAGNDRPPVMLIDAYNIIHADSILKRKMKVALALARAELETWVAEYAKEAHINCMIVYDGMGYQGRQANRVLVAPRVLTAFAGDMEADSYIAKAAQEYKQKGARNVVIMTSDQRIVGDCFDPDFVIYSLTPDQFIQDLHAVGLGIDKSRLPRIRQSWSRSEPSSVPNTVTPRPDVPAEKKADTLAGDLLKILSGCDEDDDECLQEALVLNDGGGDTGKGEGGSSGYVAPPKASEATLDPLMLNSLDHLLSKQSLDSLVSQSSMKKILGDSNMDL